MAFPHARRILSMGLSLSTYKLLLLQASVSRPRLKKLCTALLAPFIHDGEVAVHYTRQGRKFLISIRMEDAGNDLFNICELAIGSVYHMDPSFSPDIIVDAGGNIGLFSLLASAMYPSAKILILEPVSRNLTQIEKHRRLNHLEAEVLPVCLGGSPGVIPFYIRESLGSSFDETKPYTSQIDVEVVTLSDLLGARTSERILLKLDIEGMEIEVLKNFVPGETRPVFIVGELHGHRANSEHLERIFHTSGWNLRFDEINGPDSIFSAWSPAAASLAARAPLALAQQGGPPRNPSLAR